MKLFVHNTIIEVDTSYVNGEKPPETDEERIAFAKGAIQEINNHMRRYGIRVQAYVEADDCSSLSQTTR